MGFTRPIGKPRLAEAHPNSDWDIFQRNCPENYLCLVRTRSVLVVLDLIELEELLTVEAPESFLSVFNVSVDDIGPLT